MQILPDLRLTAFKDLEFFSYFDFPDDEDQDDTLISPKPSDSAMTQKRDFDPESAGFGKFFTYAACYWTEHLRRCSPDALPDVFDVSKLSRPGCLLLRNWMETYKRPNLTSSPQMKLDVEDFDELVLAARFGSHAYLIKFLESISEEMCLRDESCAKAVKWVIHSGDLTAAKILLQNESVASKLRKGSFLCNIMAVWFRMKSEQQIDEDKWKELLEILVCRFCDGSAMSYEWANTILCTAAREGCLPVIEKLFEKASAEPELTKAILADTEDRVYQSVGEAAFWGRAGTVQYLLTQDYVDVSTHLHHLANSKSEYGPSRMNVLHCAAMSGNAEVIRILVEAFPSGVNEQTKSGDTPLMKLVSTHPTNLEATRTLIENGRVDVNLSPGGTWYSPLRIAVRSGKVEMCKLLVSYGAHVDEAIEIDELSGRPILKDRLENPETSQSILKVLVSASQLEACQRYVSKLED